MGHRHLKHEFPLNSLHSQASLPSWGEMPLSLAQAGPFCCKIWHKGKGPREIFPSPPWYLHWPLDGVTQVETLKSWNTKKSPEYKKVGWKK